MDKFLIPGEVVIITGGAGLLGKEYAKAVWDMDGIPVILDVSSHKFKDINGHCIKCDITKEYDLNLALDYIHKEFHKEPYGLINNAAIDPKFDANINKSPKARLEAYGLDDWNAEVGVGLTGAFLCTKVFGSVMASQGRGSIVNVSSVLGLVAPNQALYENPDLPEEQQNVKPVTYSVIKHGIIGLTKYTATYWARKGVRCNAIAPGGVYNNHPKEFVDKLTKYIPLGRMAEKDEYNHAIQFLLSPASSFMTGSVLQIDGGQTTW